MDDRGASAGTPFSLLEEAVAGTDGASLPSVTQHGRDVRTIQFVVHGTARPKGSARGFVAMKAGKARAIVTTDNKGLKAWETAVRFAAQAHAGERLMMGPIVVHIDFYLQRPKSVSEKRRPFIITKPDLSKLIRGFEDALNEVLWKDDAQIVRIVATKNYARVDEGSRAVVTIHEYAIGGSPETSVSDALPLAEATQ